MPSSAKSSKWPKLWLMLARAWLCDSSKSGNCLWIFYICEQSPSFRSKTRWHPLPLLVWSMETAWSLSAFTVRWLFSSIFHDFITNSESQQSHDIRSHSP
jgi:hypothetical protein